MEIRPTIDDLVAAVTEVNTANGWRENKGAILTEDTPEAQIASMSFVSGGVSEVIEAVRKPTEESVVDAFDGLLKSTDLAHHMGIGDHTDYYLKYVAREYCHAVHGSKTQAICRARLIDTETEELTQAILKDDVPNLAEELADIVIRVLDFAGAWNEAHPDQPIDLQTAVLAKIERNRARGYRHGGKTA